MKIKSEFWKSPGNLLTVMIQFGARIKYMNVFTYGTSRESAYLVQDRIGALIEIGALSNKSKHSFGALIGTRALNQIIMVT